MTLPLNLHDNVDRIRAHQNGLFLFAGTINLYNAAMQRQAERVIYGPDDVDNIFTIALILLDVRPTSGLIPKARDPKPSEEEERTTLDPFSMIEGAVREIEKPLARRV